MGNTRTGLRRAPVVHERYAADLGLAVVMLNVHLGEAVFLFGQPSWAAWKSLEMGLH